MEFCTITEYTDGEVKELFRRQNAGKLDRAKLPDSINGLWKADLFIGNTIMDNWVGTTVKINPSQLESARGLRLGIKPNNLIHYKWTHIYHLLSYRVMSKLTTPIQLKAT